MLSLFKNLFTKTEEKPFHPGIFRNPLAEKVSWQPQKSGGSNFKNFKLVLNGSRSLIYKPTTVSYFVSSLFLIGPFIYFIFFFLNDTSSIGDQLLKPPFVIIIPAFLGVAIFMGYKMLRPQGFNKQLGYHYKSFKKPTSQREVPESKYWTKLDDVQAIQIIKERVKSKNSSYSSYELNLVLKDASRVNVIDHSKLDQIKEDARVIADFIGIPYWDAVSMYLYEPKMARRQTDLDADYDSTPRFREM
jgi:hypothetical protein